MLTTYKAKLHGSQIQWIDDSPSFATQNQDIEVLITILYDSHTDRMSEVIHDREEQIAECLEQIARTGGIVDIDDPVAWQRELRQDRPIFPGNRSETD